MQTPPETARKTRFIAGHFTYNLAPIFSQTPIYITMLRDPVERTISEYAQIKRSPEHFAYEFAKDRTLLEYVSDPRSRAVYGNIQTRFIGFDNPTGETGRWKITDNPENLKRALERLETFAFVGVVERYDESMAVLCDTFDWELPAMPDTLNLSTNRPSDIPQEAIDIIREHNRQDSVLYEAGKRLFETRYQQFLAEHPDFVQRHNKDVRNALLQNKVNELTKQVDVLTKRLSEIENSFGWRFILRVAALRRKLIPEGSIIERTYLRLRNRVTALSN